MKVTYAMFRRGDDHDEHWDGRDWQPYHGLCMTLIADPLKFLDENAPENWVLGRVCADGYLCWFIDCELAMRPGKIPSGENPYCGG